MRCKNTATRHIAVALLSLALCACGPLQMISNISPARHYELTPDVAYGDHKRQTLNVYAPTTTGPRTSETLSPVVIYFYGGGWRRGSKEKYEFVASSLTKAGYLVVVPDYRVHPDVTFPAFVEDGARAVAWAKQHATRYGGDADKLFLMGHSAGAHIAALLSMDARFLAEHDLDPADLRGFIGLSGPYDFLPIKAGYLLEVFPEESRRQSQPIEFVTAAAPPTLLIHGGDDSVVKPTNSEQLAKRLHEHGVPVTLKIYDGAGHARIAVALSPPFDFVADTLEDSRLFLEARSRHE